MERTGRDDRLLTDDALAFDLFNASRGIGYPPMPAKQLDIVEALVLNADVVAEHEAGGQHIGLTIQIDWANGYPYIVGYGDVGNHAAMYSDIP